MRNCIHEPYRSQGVAFMRIILPSLSPECHPDGFSRFEERMRRMLNRINIRGECLCEDFLLLFAFQEEERKRRTREERKGHRDPIMNRKVIGGRMENEFLFLKKSIDFPREERSDMSIRSQTEDDDIRSCIPEELSHFRLIFPHTLINREGCIGKEEMCGRNLRLHEQCISNETLITVFVI